MNAKRKARQRAAMEVVARKRFLVECAIRAESIAVVYEAEGRHDDAARNRASAERWRKEAA